MFREHSVKTRAAEAGKSDKPASQAVPLEQGQVQSLLSLASQEEEETKEEIKTRSWTGTKGSSCHREEVALAVAGGRGKPLLRLTSTTGKQLLLRNCCVLLLSGSLVSATYSTWEAIFLTVAVVAMATIKASTITTGGSTITTGGSTTTMEDFTTTTTMGDFTITTMEASVRVSRVITDANASTASHSVTGILVDCHIVIL